MLIFIPHMVWSNKSKVIFTQRVQWLNTGLCGIAIVRVSSENSFVLLLDGEQHDGGVSYGLQNKSHPHNHTKRHVIENTDKNTALITRPSQIMMEDNLSLPVFLFSACIRIKRKKERSGKSIRKHKPEFYIYTLLQQPQSICHYTVCETWELLFPWNHPNTVMACKHVVNPWTKLQIELWLEWNRTADRGVSQPYYRCESPSDWLPKLPWWEREIYFFPNHWHRLAHPTVVVVPRAINHLKMDMVESFPL